MQDDVEARARELLACPFCGANDATTFHSELPTASANGPRGLMVWTVFCPRCEAEGPHQVGLAEACEGWNVAVRPALSTNPAAIPADGEVAVTDAEVLAHHRYRNLREDFVTVESDLREIAIMVGHHYNSLRPVAPVVKAALASLQSTPPANEADAVAAACNACGVTPTSDMRPFAEAVASVAWRNGLAHRHHQPPEAGRDLGLREAAAVARAHMETKFGSDEPESIDEWRRGFVAASETIADAILALIAPTPDEASGHGGEGV